MKILIRKIKKGDGEGIIRCFNEALKRGLNTYTRSNTLSTPEDIKEFDKAFSKPRLNEFGFVAVDKGKNLIAGVCIFSSKGHERIRHIGEISWGVHPDYLRKGIATKLADATIREATRRKFVRIEADIAKNNTASVRLARKCRFRIEGIKKYGLLLDDGRYENTYMFSKILTKHK